MFVVGYGKSNRDNDLEVKRPRLSEGGKHDKSVDSEKKTNVSLDSRGCSIPSGSFRNAENTIVLPAVGVVPAYLIVFNT